MLEMAEGTIWGLRAILKIANCVCSGSNTSAVQYSAKRPRTAYLKQEGGVNANVIANVIGNQAGLSQQNSRVICGEYSLL